MDPFTQRMLERAKIRREKLEGQKMELEHRPETQEINSNVKRKPLTNFSENGKIIENKTDKEYMTSSRKSKLQKLAKFYSENEENLLLESDEEREGKEFEDYNNTQKKQCKLNRLTELASKIKEWDDDLGHSRQFSSNLENKKKEEQQKIKKSGKQTSLDSATVEKLCSQGFSLSQNESRLIYDFEETKEGPKNLSSLEKISAKNQKNKINCEQAIFTEKKISNKNENEGNQNEVLRKAAFFESSIKEDTPSKRVKDPAELSLAERKAMFEKNIGDAIFPKNRFGIAERKEFSKNVEPQKSKIIFEKKQNETNETFNSKKFDENEKVEPKKDYMEKNLGLKEQLDDKPTDRKVLNIVEVIPKPPPLPNFSHNNKETIRSKNEVKDVEVNSSKTGRLYPSLSNLDITDEKEIVYTDTDSLNESKNSNFYLNMTLSDLLEINKNNPTTPPSDRSFSKSKECQVLNKIDKLLENALNDLSYENEDEIEDEDLIPSPPKMMKSSSFEYKSSDNNTNPLMHTVSFYRKQQQNSCLPPNVIDSEEEQELNPDILIPKEDETVLVQNKIQILFAEVNKQQTIISQATQALNLCLSTVEFSGSGEQVEGERLLLLATHKRQACLNEIQRLKVENSLRPQGESNIFTERGDVILTNISLKLKRDALRAIAAAENLLYFVCLIKSDEQVLATSVVSATRENLKDLVLQFPGQIKLERLLSNFKITIEVYNLELNKELLPHDVKYHIINKKDKKLLTPIKSKKSESKLVKPNIQSPAGPNAVRTSNFQMCGYIVFSLREVTRTQWTLNKVPYISPLEGTISMTIQSQLRLDDEFRGFLTMFDDISGFGAWHRRWCLLSSHFISYWKYPDDENKKVPNGTIDLRSVITENVGLVSRDVCARLNTFLLESTRPRLAEDKNSLVLKVNDNVTTVRHLLSADSKQEMMAWCKKLNTTLALLRSWKCNFNE